MGAHQRDRHRRQLRGVPPAWRAGRLLPHRIPPAGRAERHRLHYPRHGTACRDPLAHHHRGAAGQHRGDDGGLRPGGTEIQGLAGVHLWQRHLELDHRHGPQLQLQRAEALHRLLCRHGLSVGAHRCLLGQADRLREDGRAGTLRTGEGRGAVPMVQLQRLLERCPSDTHRQDERLAHPPTGDAVDERQRHPGYQGGFLRRRQTADDAAL